MIKHIQGMAMLMSIAFTLLTFQVGQAQQWGINPWTGIPFGSRVDASGFWNDRFRFRGIALSQWASERRVISEAIVAQSIAIRNIERARIDNATARILYAEAVDKELDNWLKRIRTYFDSRVANITGKEDVENAKDYARDEYWRRHLTASRRKWELMKNQPEYVGAVAESGRGLNFLLDRFHGTPIAYGVPLEEVLDFKVDQARWSLNPELLADIRVKTINGGKGVIEFQLDAPTKIPDDFPFMLDSDDFRRQIDHYRNQRQLLIDLSVRAPLETRPITEFELAVNDLRDAFFAKYPHDTWRCYENHVILDLIECRKFFERSKMSLRHIRTSRSAIPKGYDAINNSIKDAPSLVAWMTRTGLEFEPARSPDQNASYNTLYNMLGELYTTYGEPIMDVPQTPRPEGAGFDNIQGISGNQGGIIGQ